MLIRWIRRLFQRDKYARWRDISDPGEDFADRDAPSITAWWRGPHGR